MTPVVFSLAVSDHLLAEKISAAIGAEHIRLAQNALDDIAAAFRAGRPVIGLLASGILIRAIAPWLAGKQKDVSVIAVSPDGSNIVPLIGGHRGANALAQTIAEATGGNAIITTASDYRYKISLDDPPTGLELANPADFKPFAVSLLKGEKIHLNRPDAWLEDSDLPVDDAGTLQISITEHALKGSPTHLVYHPRTIVLGLGCERGTNPEELTTLVERCLEKANIAKQSIAMVATIDIKADEAAINHVADGLGVPLRLFSADALNNEAHRLENPSQIVMAEVGCPGVAEGACLAASSKKGKLVVAKTKSARATCAIARAPVAFGDEAALPGRARGRLAIVGIGPGAHEWRSPQAKAALRRASDWVGYGLYLDLISDLKSGQVEHRFNLGKEEARVRHAFKLAGQGKNVALVCSGDAAIYAMAALVYEVLDKGDLSLAETRIAIETLPGISAFQAASARAGALIGHDFCTISLSDLLTPWDTIEKRLHAAAVGDFNIAFYNPRSLKRTDQLQKAIDILKPHRQADTPVIIASNLGRPGEKVTALPLAQFKPEDVDMLTIVLIGSSQSKIITRGDGQPYCYTPRGYANKDANKGTSP